MSHGFCECGCGTRTRIAPQTRKARGWIKGEPLRFLPGHHMRLRRPSQLSDPEWLAREYTEKERSGLDLAAELGCDWAAVYAALRRHGIAVRQHGGNSSPTHGHTSGGCVSPTYRSWASMLSRCRDPAQTSYEHYGGRGITVCSRWGSFDVFLIDMGDRPEGRTLDRIDPEGDYEPDNCRWATALEQRHNRRDKVAA